MTTRADLETDIAAFRRIYQDTHYDRTPPGNAEKLRVLALRTNSDRDTPGEDAGPGRRRFTACR